MLLLLILLSLLLWIDRETTRISTASGFVKLPMLVRDDNDDDNDNVDRFDFSFGRRIVVSEKERGENLHTAVSLRFYLSAV